MLDRGPCVPFYTPMKQEFDRIAGEKTSAALPHPYYLGLVHAVSSMARRAGKIIMQYHGKHYDIEIKDDESPVTIADQKSSEYLVTALSKMTPNWVVVSEENETVPQDSANATYWTIDPLDGTREFIERTGGFCVKIALIAQARPVLGVIYCPVQDVLYTGVENGTAIKITGTNPPQEIQTRNVTPGEKLSVLFNRKHADYALYREARLALAAQNLILPVHPKTKPGLPRSMQVAEGLADIHAGTGTSAGSGYIWDVAADDVILTNAGGAFYALKTGQSLIYDQPRQCVPGYMAIGDISLRTKPLIHP